MPFTLRRSSGLAKGALPRGSTMACAFDGPIPGRVPSSAADAVLRFTFASKPESAARAPVPRSRSPQRSPTTTFLARFIPTSSWRLCGRRTLATNRKARTSTQGQRVRSKQDVHAASPATIRLGVPRQLPFHERLCYSPEPHVGGYLHGV